MRLVLVTVRVVLLLLVALFEREEDGPYVLDPYQAPSFGTPWVSPLLLLVMV